MIPFFAQVPPAEFMLYLLLGIVLLEKVFAAITRVRGGAEKHEIAGQPISVAVTDQFVSRPEFIELKEKCTHIEREMHIMERNILHAGEERAKALHERINDLVLAVGRVEGKIQGGNQ